MKFYTYLHTRADDKKVFYVGKGTARDNRAGSHKGRNAFWKRTVAKHGYIVDICMRFEKETDAFEHEKFLIRCFRDRGAPLANIADGGEGPSGFVHSAETRAKLSVAGKGRKRTPEQVAASAAGNRKHKRSPEQRAMLSLAQTGRVCKEETKEKLRAINTGTRHSEETRLKMSAAQKGVPKEQAHIAAVLAARMAGGGYKKGPEAALKAWATKRAKAAACTA